MDHVLDDPGVTASDSDDSSQLYTSQVLQLLKNLYDLTYEDAVLTGNKSSPTTSPSHSPANSPTAKRKSPRRSPSSKNHPTVDAVAVGNEGNAADGNGGNNTNTNLSTSETTSTCANDATVLVTRELMNALLPPKSWVDPAIGKWQRIVSMDLSSRSDVLKLWETLDMLLVETQARPHAICPLREKFFVHVFDEIIRQVTCDCPERGLLLLRMRDELRLTIETYQTLFNSSICFGRNKAVEAEVGMNDLEETIGRLEAQKKRLETHKHDLMHRTLTLEDQIKKDETRRKETYANTLQFLQSQKLQLETFLRELGRDEATSSSSSSSSTATSAMGSSASAGFLPSNTTNFASHTIPAPTIS